jgi:hypothetical protein
MLCAYTAASAFLLIVRPLVGFAACLFAMTVEQSSYYTMLATLASGLAIAFTGGVAIYALVLGNRDKRNDRATAVFRILQTDPFITLMLKLQPFSDKDHNRTYHSDSWHNQQTLFVKGIPIQPMPSSQYGQSVVAVANTFEELYLHLKYKLVAEQLILEASSLLVLTFYYYVQPILADIEDYANLDFGNLRRLARKAQDWLRKHEPNPDQSLLALDTADRKR